MWNGIYTKIALKSLIKRKLTVDETATGCSKIFGVDLEICLKIFKQTDRFSSESSLLQIWREMDSWKNINISLMFDGTNNHELTMVTTATRKSFKSSKFFKCFTSSSELSNKSLSVFWYMQLCFDRLRRVVSKISSHSDKTICNFS